MDVTVLSWPPLITGTSQVAAVDACNALAALDANRWLRVGCV